MMEQEFCIDYRVVTRVNLVLVVQSSFYDDKCPQDFPNIASGSVTKSYSAKMGYIARPVNGGIHISRDQTKTYEDGDK